MEMLSCVTQGMSNKEIAGLLGISYQTVKNQVKTIFQKLRMNDPTQTAIFGLR